MMQVTKTMPGAVSGSVDQMTGRVDVRVIADNGALQAAMDRKYGPGVVVYSGSPPGPLVDGEVAVTMPAPLPLEARQGPASDRRRDVAVRRADVTKARVVADGGSQSGVCIAYPRCSSPP